MAHPDSLVIGCDYFVVHYYDKELLVPSVMTVRYVGCVADDDGNPEWTFSEPRHLDDPIADECEPLIAFDEDHLFQVLHLEEAINELNEVRQVRPASVPPPPARLDKDQLLARLPLAKRVHEFLAAAHFSKLQVSVRYLDQALFLEKRAGALSLQLFTHPLRAAAEQARLNVFFRGRDLSPASDYPADRGRTRIVKYEVPTSATEITDLCAALIVDVWQITERDELKFATD
jgi:hypothetical protein